MGLYSPIVGKAEMYDKEKDVNILIGDARNTLKELSDSSVNCIVTSPPYYGLRSYIDNDSPDKQYEVGIETTPEKYIESLCEVFSECYRVLSDDGVMFVNIADTYNGAKKHNTSHKHSKEFTDKNKTINKRRYSGAKDKDLIGIPFMLAFALRDYGWYWRDTIIWAKGVSGTHVFGSCMPESVKDRTNKSHEYIFMFTKSPKYYYDWESVSEYTKDISNKRCFRGGNPDNRKRAGEYDYAINTDAQLKFFAKRKAELEQNPNRKYKRIRRSVWTMKSSNSRVGHFAVYPPELAETCILAGCPKDGVVLDPFGGSGTTSVVANYLGRKAVHCELNSNAVEIFEQRRTELLKLMKKVESVETSERKCRTLW